MATDPQSLIDEAKCYVCYGTPGEIQLMRLALLKQKLLSLDPMADTSPQALLADAKCYNCNGMPGEWALMELALLSKIATAQNPSADVSPQGLISSGSCYNCYGPGLVPVMELALMAQISNGGSGPSTCENLEGADPNPNGIITPDFVGQVYVTSGHIWQAGSLLNNSWVDITPAGSVTGLVFNTGDTNVPDLDWNADLPGITSVDFSNITIADANIRMAQNSITTFTANSLVTVTNNFYIQENSITGLSFPALETVGGDFNFAGNPITSFSAPLLETIAGEFDCDAGGQLATLSLPSLTSVASNLHFNDNVLVTVSFPNLVMPDSGQDIFFANNALSAASVNHILARCVSSNLSSSNIDLSGGTNAAPTGQGILDSATLTGNGCSVSTN